jgi:hypothetical protein
LKGHTAIAKVINHEGKENAVAMTVEIGNSKTAQQQLGVRNIP